MVIDTPSKDIRQVCLRLKPLIGNKADQIYQAYLAEDADGKKQIERYLELLTATYTPQKLGQSENILLPPPQQAAAGQYPVGQVTYLDKKLYPFGLREDEWIQHVAIFGRSGAGKTNAGFTLLKALNDHQKPFLIFDWKRNYRDLLSLPEFKNTQVYTIGRNVVPFTFNPLIPPAGTDPRTWLKKLNEVIAHSYCLGNGVLFLLQQAVDSVYDQAGVYDGTVQNWPTFKDVLVKARNMDTRGRESGWLSSTLRALSSLCFGDMDKLLNTNHNTSLDHLLDHNVIFELDALTQSDKVFFIQAMLLWIHHKRMTEEKRETFKHIIVIEESHHVLSDERRSLIGGQSVMEILFREIREFGESLVLLDQHPSKISLPALGNTYCTICLNLKHKTDVNAMGQCFLMDRERQLLGTLEVGQAVVKLQGRIARPFQIEIPLFEIEKGKITDQHIQDHMKTVAAPFQQADFRLPAAVPSIAGPVVKPEPEDPLLRSLLWDIRQFPQSGIAARYKRLGISVRQGQKLKDQLLQKKLIEEQIQTSATGRIRTITLTEKAQILLCNHKTKK